MAQFLFDSLFILEYRKVIRSDNNGLKGIQQMWQFWKWNPAPVRELQLPDDLACY